jgi:ribosomal protein S18 acetylase RimI-like enzyme
MTVSLREERTARADDAFIKRLLLETISTQLGAGAWPEALRETLLAQQCDIRLMSRRGAFPQGHGWIIQIDGADAGWLFVADSPDEIRIVEIVIAEAHSGQGAGTDVIRGLLAEAEALGKPVRLSVNLLNTGAARLYHRLGFRRTGGDATQDFLEWRSGGRK